MKSRKRKSLSLRLQPYEGTCLAEVVDYLNTMEKELGSKMVGDLLVMCLLPYARLDSSHPYTEPQLRRTCLESCDTINKHASTMRQTLGVEQPQFAGQNQVSLAHVGSNGSAVEVKASVASQPELESPQSKIKGLASVDDLNALFQD